MFAPFSYTTKYSKKESKNNGGLKRTLNHYVTTCFKTIYFSKTSTKMKKFDILPLKYLRPSYNSVNAQTYLKACGMLKKFA